LARNAALAVSLAARVCLVRSVFSSVHLYQADAFSLAFAFNICARADTFDRVIRDEFLFPIIAIDSPSAMAAVPRVARGQVETGD